MFIAASFIIVKNPNAQQLMNGYRKHAIYPHDGTLFSHKKQQSTDSWMNPENSMRSEGSQTQKATY